MDTDKTTEGDVDTTNNEGEGSQGDVVTIPKTDWEKTNQTLGSLKKELKDLKKGSEKSKEETPTENHKSDDALSQRYERLALKQAGLTHADDVDLARKIAKETGKDIEDVLESRYFKVELEALQTNRANVEATSHVKGSGSNSSNSKAKESPEYWMGKENPPTPQDIPDSRLRQSIIQKMIMAKRNNKTLKFYNE